MKNGIALNKKAPKEEIRVLLLQLFKEISFVTTSDPDRTCREKHK